MPTPAEITLRIVVSAESSEHGFTMEVVELGHPALHAAGTLMPQLPKKLPADLHWYLEKFLDERDDAALVRARHIRESIKVCGNGLFKGSSRRTQKPGRSGGALRRDSVKRGSRLSKAVNTVACRGNSCGTRQPTRQSVFRQPHSSAVTE